MMPVWLALVILAGIVSVGLAGECIRLLFDSVLFGTGIWVLRRQQSGVHYGSGFLMAVPCYGIAQWALSWTEYRHATLESVAGWAALDVLFQTTRCVVSAAGARDRFLRTLLAGGSVVMFAGLFQFYSHGRGMGPFVNRDHFAAFGELLLGIAIWESLRLKAPQRLLGMCAVVLLFVAIVASGSRAGTVLATAEVLCFPLLCRTLDPWRHVRGMAVWCMAAVALLGGWQLTWGRFLQANPLKGRQEIFTASVAMIGNRPWTGFGLGAYKVVYPQFAVFDPGTRIDHAHNDWLEWTAEGGLPFTLLLMAFFVSAIRKAHPYAWGAGAVLMHATVDFPMHVPALAAAVIGMLAAGSRLLRDNPASQVSQALYANDNIVSGSQPAGRFARKPDAGRSARRDNVAGLQRERG